MSASSSQQPFSPLGKLVSSVIGLLAIALYFTGWIYRWFYFGFFQVELTTLNLSLESFYIASFSLLFRSPWAILKTIAAIGAAILGMVMTFKAVAVLRRILHQPLQKLIQKLGLSANGRQGFKGGTKLMQIEIQGQDAIKVAEDIVTLDGIQGDFEVVSEVEREGTLATIATIIGITTGAMTIAEKLYELNKKSVHSPESVKIERVLLVGKNGDHLLLKDATLEQLQKLLEREKSFENESDVSWRDKIIWRLEEQPQLLTDEALDLASGTRVKLIVEAIPPEEQKKPKSFLQTAQSLQLKGEVDWSEKIDQYLYGDPSSGDG
jgi:hypothetical protein